MIAVIYNPDNGVILSTMIASEENIALNGAYLPVTEYREDYDALYIVSNGNLVLKTDSTPST